MPPDQDAHKAAIRRFHDATNSRDLQQISAAADELYAPDALIHTPVSAGAGGAQSVKQGFAMLLQAFPDLHVEIEDLLADGETLVSRNVVSGTHRGEFMGHPPSGARVSYPEIFIFRFDGDRVAESWGVVDVFGLLRQMGLVASPF